MGIIGCSRGRNREVRVMLMVAEGRGVEGEGRGLRWIGIDEMSEEDR